MPNDSIYLNTGPIDPAENIAKVMLIHASKKSEDFTAANFFFGSSNNLSLSLSTC